MTKYAWKTICVTMVLATMGAVQAQAQTLFFEDFNGDGTNETLEDMSTASWTRDGAQHGTNRESGHGAYDPSDPQGPTCCYGSHPGQGGRSSSQHAVPSQDLAAIAPVAVDASYIHASDGNSWSWAGLANSMIRVGSGMGQYGADYGDSVAIGAQQDAVGEDASMRIWGGDELGNVVETFVDTTNPADARAVVQVRAVISATGSEVFWRPISGIDGETNIDWQNDITGAWRSIGILDGVATVDSVQLINSGSTHATEFDSIHLLLTPEPASAVLLALGGLTMLRRRRR